MGFDKAGEGYFSPDGKNIVFQAVPKSKKNYQIFIMNLEEQVPKMISTGKGACTCAYFKPDGKKVIFASSHEAPDNINDSSSCYQKEGSSYKWDLTPYMNIYEADLDGANLKALTKGAAYKAECTYSPDGSKIVFASNMDGNMNIYVMDSDGSNIIQITKDKNIYNGGPFFSPDGKKIIFRVDAEKKDYLQIYIMNNDGSKRKKLTHNDAVNWAPFWHPSGKFIAYTTSLHGHWNYEIYLLGIKTLQNYRITFSNSFDGLPAFNQEGNLMLWTSKRTIDKTCQLFIADFKLNQETQKNA